MGVAGETYWPVPSLAVPDAGAPPAAAVQDLTRYEAVGLFVERARSRLPGWLRADARERRGGGGGVQEA